MNPPNNTRALRIITALINISLLLHTQPDTMILGLITMVPKKDENGNPTSTADKMRPITVLPALLRLTNRLLSIRIQAILNRNPSYLHSAQRVFTWNGSTDQSIDTFLDVIEDHAMKTDHQARCSPLFVASYDQRKAYDSVQPYTVRASLERSNFSEQFILYVLWDGEHA
jgi:hypothetical protein